MATAQPQARDPTRKESTYIRSHASKLRDLPPPGEEWTTDDIPDHLEENLRRHAKLNIIERVANPELDVGTQQVYQTTRMGWETIHHYIDDDDDRTLPDCEHTGWTHTGTDEKPYECLTCETRYTADELPVTR